MAKIQSRYLMAGGAGLLAAAMAFTGGGEGVKYIPYYDTGHVLTVCRGHTGPDIIPGRRYTEAECDKLFEADIVAHEKRLLACAPELAAVPGKTYIAINDWAFNVGTGAACKSTLIRKARGGDLKGACNELSIWVYVNHQFVKGLANRRVSERALCMEGLK